MVLGWNVRFGNKSIGSDEESFAEGQTEIKEKSQKIGMTINGKQFFHNCSISPMEVDKIQMNISSTIKATTQ